MVLLETGNWKLTTPSDSLLHTACVNHRPWRARWICPPSLSRAPADFVVGKNYRLQDIQLSKIIRGKYRPSELTVARGAFPRTPFAHSLAGPQSPAPFVRVFAWNVGSVAARPTFLSYGSACIPASRAVENFCRSTFALRATADNLRLARLMACQP
jgi:hypothetical protein